jgi:hypothetical protein
MDGSQFSLSLSLCLSLSLALYCSLLKKMLFCLKFQLAFILGSTGCFTGTVWCTERNTSRQAQPLFQSCETDYVRESHYYFRNEFIFPLIVFMLVVTTMLT